MKIAKILLLFLTLVIVSASALAYSVSIGWSMNQPNYEVELYPCSNSVCSSVGSRILYDTASGYNYNMYYTIPGNAYHAAYFYKPGYRPIGYTLNAWGDWSTSFSSSFTKKDYCESTIGTLSVSDSNPTIGETIIIGAPISGAFTISDDHPQSPRYYPSSHIDYFISDIDASLRVYSSSGSLVVTLPSQVNGIYQDDAQSVSFNLDTTSLSPGDYRIVLSTDPVDSICDQNNKIIRSKELWVTVDPVVIINTPPIISGISDLSFAEDSGFYDDVVDLWFYASDAETPDSGLTFTILSQSNAGIVNCVLDSNRYVDCTTQTNQNGYSDVTVEVRAPEGLTDTDTFRVTVTPVNDAPVVSGTGVQDQTIDSCHEFATFDLDNYITDVDNADLTWAVTGNTQLIITIDTATHVVTIFYPTGFVGSETVTFTATDSEGLTVSDSAVLTITQCASSNTAPELNNLPDKELEEDSGDNDKIIELWDYASDDESSDSELDFSITDQTNTNLVTCSISSDRYIDCEVEDGKTGISYVTVQVRDPQGLTDTDTFKVTVEKASDSSDSGDDRSITIMSVTYDDKVKAGDYMRISINVKGLTDGIITTVRIDDLDIYETFNKVSGIHILIPNDAKLGVYDFQISVKNDESYKDSVYRSFEIISGTSGSDAGIANDGNDEQVTGASVVTGTTSGSTSSQGQNGFNLEGIYGLLIGFTFLLLVLGVLAIFYVFKNTKGKKKKSGLEKNVYYNTAGIPQQHGEITPAMPRRTFHGAEDTEKFIYGSQQPSSNKFLRKT
ncbi:MAG: Ig-like domain-containing protein [Nanoarchaeota archaeon]|nr:Ig-like domain-containing protein [Nanoarchaeota archaeon]